jgi:hypothetical protein
MRLQMLKPLPTRCKNDFFRTMILISIPICMLLSCKKEYSCDNCRDGNRPPFSKAGADQTITLPKDSVKLDGSASTDPDGSITNYKWTKISGPSSFNITNANVVQTQVTNLAAGVYRFELTVTDNTALFAKDTVQIMVDAPGNQPPVACAGPNQTIALPVNSATLDRGCSGDPDNNITGYAWTKISGPPSFNITNANAVQTQITNLAAGVYLFELKVTDAGGVSAKDTVQIMVETQSGDPLLDVYVSGDENGKACYWKNGVKQALNTLSPGYHIATSIAVSGSDIYVAGGEVPTAFPDGPTIAKYWKNGNEVILGKELYSSANSIAVVNNDVYVAGSESKFWNSGFVAKYWKNGQAVLLTNGSKNASANSIFVVGEDVYVAGKEGNVAKYWKNGQAVPLTNGAADASASSIFVVGEDVYVAGRQGNVAKYWKNGQAVSLTNGLYEGYASSITVVGNDVYVAGVELGELPKYWKNGQPVSLYPDYGSASSICVNNNDVYVVGTGYVAVGGSYPLYWKNGQVQTLADYGTSSCIVIVQR